MSVVAPIDEWLDVKLGDILEFKYGKSLPAKTRDGKGPVVYGSNGVVGNHSIPLVYGEGIVVGRKGSFGEVHLSLNSFFPIDTTYFIDEFSGQSIKYWYYQLKYLPLTKLNRSTAIPGLNREDAYSLKIQLPSQAEQKKIAAKLDELLAQVDTLKTRLDTIPTILKRFRQSVLAAAVSGKLTEAWRGSETSKWQSVKLQDIANIIDPQPSHRTPAEVQNGVPYIGIGDLNSDGSINFDRARKVSVDVLDEHKGRYTLNKGDFVFGKIGTLGKATFLPVDRDYTLSANVILIQPLVSRVLPVFLMYFLSSPATMDEVAKQSNSTSQAAFGIKKMREFKSNIPEIEEQTEIVRQVEQYFTFADQIEQRVKDAQKRVNNLTQSILAKAFRGELTADWREQNPDLIRGENSAEVMLQKIKAEREAMKPVKKSAVKKKKVVP